MRKVPNNIKQEIATDPFYRKCIVCGTTNNINIHHVLIGGRQRDEKCFLVPLCFNHHEQANTKQMIDYCEWVSFNRTPIPLLKELNLLDKMRRLNIRIKTNDKK